MPSPVLLQTFRQSPRYCPHQISFFYFAVRFRAKTIGVILNWRNPTFSPFCPQPHFQGTQQGSVGRVTHGDILEVDAGDVVVGAALPGVVEAEGERARVPPVQCRELAERAVLDVDGPVVELDPSDGKIPKTHPEEAERLGHGTLALAGDVF